MTIRVFVSGQSNALGRGAGGPSWAGVDSRVRVWNNANPLGANGSGWATASDARATHETFQFLDRNNFGVWFCHRAAQVRDDDVYMTIVARGGTAIEAWGTSSPSVPMLQECIDVYATTGQDPADVFLWHQGEGNTSTPAVTYKSDFLALVSNLTNAGVIDANTVIIVGGLSEDNQSRIDFNNNVLRALANENPNIYYANSSGLSSYDGTHFDGQSLYTLGAERFFAAYSEAEGINMADLFALINEGGTPGEPGTGENKLYNLLNLALIGMGKKDIAESPDFTGTIPVDGLLTAGMLAAGSVVEYGTDPVNGSYVRFESGIQICFARLIATYVNASLLSTSWTFPRIFLGAETPFETPYCVAAVPNISIAANNFSGAKRGGSILTTNSFGNGESGGIRLESSGLYTSGDETCGIMAFAIGFWK